MGKIRESLTFPKPLLFLRACPWIKLTIDSSVLLNLIIHNAQRALPVSKVSTVKLVSSLFKFLQLEVDEIAIYFVSKKRICTLHKTYFNNPSATDTISFPLDRISPTKRTCLPEEQDPSAERSICPRECKKRGLDTSNPIDGYCHLGEVFVCPEVAIEYAQQRGLDPYLETTLYLVHGILHLIGYDDISPQERKKMRYQEKRCIHHLKNTDSILKRADWTQQGRSTQRRQVAKTQRKMIYKNCDLASWR